MRKTVIFTFTFFFIFVAVCTLFVPVYDERQYAENSILELEVIQKNNEAMEVLKKEREQLLAAEKLEAERKAAEKEYWAKIEKTLAIHAYHEARGEGDEGLAMVIHNVLTRVMSDRFPSSVLAVVYQENLERKAMPCEYDWVCNGRSHHVPLEEKKEILETVVGVLSGEISNPCPDGAFYFNPKKVKNKPSFALEAAYVNTVGNHECYKALPWDQFVKLRAEERKNNRG